jgi:hypothetical protein
MIVGSAHVFSDWGTFESKARLSSEVWKNFVHQSVFTRLEVAKKYKFNKLYKAASDYDFVYNLYINNYNIISLQLIVSDIIFVKSGFSAKNEIRSLSEVLVSIYSHSQRVLPFFYHFSFHFIALLRKLVSIPIRSFFPHLILYIRKFRDA